MSTSLTCMCWKLIMSDPSLLSLSSPSIYSASITSTTSFDLSSFSTYSSFCICCIFAPDSFPLVLHFQHQDIGPSNVHIFTLKTLYGCYKSSIYSSSWLFLSSLGKLLQHSQSIPSSGSIASSILVVLLWVLLLFNSLCLCNMSCASFIVFGYMSCP